MRGTGTDVSTALPSAVDERMFNRIHSPAFLIKHSITQNTPDSQLWIFFDGVVLQVFVTTITVNQVLPIGALWRTSFNKASPMVAACTSNGL